MTLCRKCRVPNSAMEVFAASDGEWSDSEFRRLYKLPAKDYQYVLHCSLDLIDTVNQTLAHQIRHSQQLITIPRMKESFSAEIVLHSRQVSKFSCIARTKEQLTLLCNGIIPASFILRNVIHSFFVC